MEAPRVAQSVAVAEGGRGHAGAAWRRRRFGGSARGSIRVAAEGGRGHTQHGGGARGCRGGGQGHAGESRGQGFAGGSGSLAAGERRMRRKKR